MRILSAVNQFAGSERGGILLLDNRSDPSEIKLMAARNLSDGRRNFCDVAGNFPDQCQYVLEALAQVYKNDKIAKERKMTPGQRLSFHQLESGQLMEDLRTWLEEQLDQKKVEPNSSLGRAISYMLKHWKELTAFLLPMSNNT